MSHIQWYPGHIAKAERNLKEKLSLIDVVIEVLDARLPLSSKYLDVEKLIKDKPRVLIFNKSDLADSSKIQFWLDFYKDKLNVLTIATNSSLNNISQIINLVVNLANPIMQKRKEKGLLPRPVRTMVIGLPNVGKSTIINRLTKSSKTKTGMKAGVTKMQQWVRINDKVELLDTPGIIPPKMPEQETAIKLACVSSVGEKAFDDEFVASELLKILTKNYKTELFSYYKIEDDEISIEKIALSRNWIIKGGNPDIVRASAYILNNFRDGKIGKFTLDEQII
ncbi:ribosome biogenesis GTPase YlqF [bacterium]|nr:ribosome biogenesis GTPase YlqF [bacterium]